MSAVGDFTARVVETRMLCDDILGCVLEAPGRFDFQPGQHVRLTVGEGKQAEARYYSIASPPGDGKRFELAIQVGDDPGRRWLLGLEKGAKVAAWGPGGGFRLRGSLRDSIFVATGAGITPLRSMLESLLPESNGCHIELIYGARSPERLLYRERWQQLEQLHPSFTFSPTVTRPDSAWAGAAGRVQGRLEAVVEGREAAVDVYFCGRPEMIAECCELLRARGVDPACLHFERYG